ncbi:MAG: hypothetical protein ACPKPY_11810 [Nitrososphaeraceae archaeon]
MKIEILIPSSKEASISGSPTSRPAVSIVVASSSCTGPNSF